jgi:CSLREA domain-containing protein
MKTRPALLHRIAITLLSIAAATQAMAITVTNTTDGAAPGPAGSLRKAINDAAAGDTINFSVSVPAGITLTAGQLLISKNLTIVGPGARNLTISGNNASRIFEVAAGVTMDMSGLTLTGGNANLPSASVRFGGAIYNSGTLTITACRIIGNKASSQTANGDGSGGGIFNYIGGTLTMRDSEISNNLCDSAQSEGGGIFNVGTANLTNCTVSNNQVSVFGKFQYADGAGISNYRYGTNGVYGAATLNLVNCTINNNYIRPPADPNNSLAGGGIFKSSDATVNIRNTIVAQNSCPASGQDVYGQVGPPTVPFNSQGHNLIGISNDDTGNTGWITDQNDPNRDYTGTVSQPLVPGLVDPDGSFSPVNNGGPTNTVALLSTSAAIDRGDDVVLSAPYNLANDQRGPGFPRKLATHTDIGAFERDQPQIGPAFVVTTTDDHSDGLCGIVDCTLMEALDASNANANANTITFNIPTSDPGYDASTQVYSINLTRGELSVTSPVSIDGGNARIAVGRAAAAPFRVFTVTASGVTLANLFVRNGAVVGTPNAPGLGGGVFNSGGLTLLNCALSGNTAMGGAGTPQLGQGLPGGNGVGGAVYNDGALVMTNCTLTANSVQGGTGGPGISAPGLIGIGGNGGNGEGGGLFSEQGTVTITNCTFTQNTALPGAPGTGQAGNGNPGVAVGGGALFASGNAALRNSIVSGNTGGGAPDYAGTASSKANLIGGTPQLDGALKYNGGATPTIALLAGSPAINAGDDTVAPGTDQRGFPRVGVSDIGAFEFGSSAPAPATALANISGRLPVGTGDNALFAGFIVTGTQPKKVIVRAIGPSLGVAGGLTDPTLELRDGSGALLQSNDNWKDSANKQAIIDSGVAPTNDLESAIVATLPASPSGTNYTAIVRGAGNATGIGVVDLYDLDRSVDSKLANISNRGFVQTGDNVLFAGMIVLGQAPQKVIIRALGPSTGVPGAMADPTLELHDANGGLLEANDNWVDSPNKQAIIDSTIPPSNNLESAIVRTLSPANYTAIVRGANNSTGIAVAEVYALQ